MELDMPITRVLLNSGPGGLLDSNMTKLMVQPAQVLSKLPIQLDMSPSKVNEDGSDLTAVGKIYDSNKYKMSVARRNERERRRVQNVNRTFDTLRHHVQGYKNANKKMSKVETLRCAVEYIRELRTILGLFEDDGALCAAVASEAYGPASVSSNFDYQMPITPSSPIQTSQTSSFDYPGEACRSPHSSNASSPLPPSPPASTPPAVVDTLPRHGASELVPTSPVSPVVNFASGTTILADRLRMPPLNASPNVAAVVVKQEPFECVTPEVSAEVLFDFNARSTTALAATATAALNQNALPADESVLDEQSFSRLAAALQAHAGQSLSQLNFNDYQYSL